MSVNRVLVTGHRGFVGRAFMRHFAGKDVALHLVDILDGNDVRDFVKVNEIRYDLVIHLAAIVGGRATIEGEPLKVATDLAIDADVIQWALKTRPERFVYFSSSAAYPIDLQTPMSKGWRLAENDISLDPYGDGSIVPDMTYGWAKLTGEYQCQFLAADGVRTHVFRPFSGYGTDQDPSYPFPAFIRRALDRVRPFHIWGTGEQVRDFIHIDDIVAAVFAAIEADVQGPVNLCTGIPTSFNQLAVDVGQVMRQYVDHTYETTFAHIEDAPVGVAYRVGDPAKMLQFYTPKIELREGIRRALLGQT